MLTFTSARASRNLVTALILALALWVGGTGVAFGHAHLREASPAQGSTVTELPAEVALKFSEPVEIGFSTFKVYPLAPEEDEAALRAAARQLMEEVLTARDDEGARADTGVATAERTSSEVVLRLKDELEPGPYVVMWRVLSVDTHVTQGYYIFTYAP